MIMTPTDATGPLRSTLAGDEAHLWLASPEELRDPSLLAAYARLMSSDEHEKQQRYRFDKQRHEQLVTRALVRTTLSRYADVLPTQWIFTTNEYGCPSLAPGQCTLPLRFNLSHTDGLIACAVTLDREIGVDVERVNRDVDTVALADGHFARQEVDDLLRLPPAEQHERFFAYWTLKEAYIKARGMGLSIPLGDFAFRLGENDQIGISFSPRIHDDPSTWMFRLYRPSPTHMLAVGVRRQPGEELRIDVRKTIPLRD